MHCYLHSSSGILYFSNKLRSLKGYLYPTPCCLRKQPMWTVCRPQTRKSESTCFKKFKSSRFSYIRVRRLMTHSEPQRTGVSSHHSGCEKRIHSFRPRPGRNSEPSSGLLLFVELIAPIYGVIPFLKTSYPVS